MDELNYIDHIPAPVTKPAIQELVDTVNNLQNIEDKLDDIEKKLGSSGKPYIALRKIKNYLYQTVYTDLDYDFAKEYFDKDSYDLPVGGCSTVKNGIWAGRNYDWEYGEDVTFVVNTPHIANRYASISISTSIPGVTEQYMEVGEYDKDLFKLIPFFAKDGVNEYGVYIADLVVPAQYGKCSKEHPSKPLIDNKLSICSYELIRYVLDNFKTAKDAVEYIRDYVSVFTPKSISDKGYELHFMISDSDTTYSLEWIEDENGDMIAEISFINSQPYMTNFYLHNVEFIYDGSYYVPENGGVYTPATVSSGSPLPTVRCNIQSHGDGLERYNLIAANYGSTATKEGMRNMMSNLLRYTNSYKTTTNPQWNTEFTGVFTNPETGEEVELTVDDPEESFETIKSIIREIYERRERDKLTWFTESSSVYDIKNKKLYLVVQEDGEEIEFQLEYYTKDEISKNLVWERGKGECSVQMSDSACSANAEYSVAEGWNSQTIVSGTKQGSYSHAEGYMASTLGQASHAEGVGTVTNNDSEHAEGSYNISNIDENGTDKSKNTQHSIGIGTSLFDKKNALEVMQNGDMYVIDMGGYDGTNFASAIRVQDLIPNNHTVSFYYKDGDEERVFIKNEIVPDGNAIEYVGLSEEIYDDNAYWDKTLEELSAITEDIDVTYVIPAYHTVSFYYKDGDAESVLMSQQRVVDGGSVKRYPDIPEEIYDRDASWDKTLEELSEVTEDIDVTYIIPQKYTLTFKYLNSDNTIKEVELISGTAVNTSDYPCPDGYAWDEEQITIAGDYTIYAERDMTAFKFTTYDSTPGYGMYLNIYNYASSQEPLVLYIDDVKYELQPEEEFYATYETQGVHYIKCEYSQDLYVYLSDEEGAIAFDSIEYAHGLNHINIYPEAFDTALDCYNAYTYNFYTTKAVYPISMDFVTPLYSDTSHNHIVDVIINPKNNYLGYTTNKELYLKDDGVNRLLWYNICDSNIYESSSVIHSIEKHALVHGRFGLINTLIISDNVTSIKPDAFQFIYPNIISIPESLDLSKSGLSASDGSLSYNPTFTFLTSNTVSITNVDNTATYLYLDRFYSEPFTLLGAQVTVTDVALNLYFSKASNIYLPTTLKHITQTGNSRRITSIHIPGDSVESISDYAFSGCTICKNVYCKCMVAPTPGADIFRDFPSYGNIHVPEGATGYESWMDKLDSTWKLVYDYN